MTKEKTVTIMVYVGSLAFPFIIWKENFGREKKKGQRQVMDSGSCYHAEIEEGRKRKPALAGGF